MVCVKYRVQKKRFEELERKRKEEILEKMKIDHQLSKEIISIMRNSVTSSAPKKSGLSRSSHSRMLVINDVI